MFLLAVPAALTGQPAEPSDSSIIAGMESLVAQEKAGTLFSGVILVARGDRILFLRAFGLADRDNGVPNRTDTKFRIASMTKMFTGVAIAQLVQSGKLGYTDTIARLLPGLEAPWAREVTVRQLLTHTSGLGSIWSEAFSENPGNFRTVRDYLPLAAQQELQFRPGSDWSYSNAGYVLLGAIIETLTGRDYRSHIRDSIFARAGMSVAPDDDAEFPASNRAIPYTRGGVLRTRLENGEGMGLQTMMPAGGAVLSAEDLWRFARALLTNRLLDSASTDFCTIGKVRYRATASYAFGFANEFVRQDTIIFHDGGADGISTNMDVFPGREIIAIVLSNYDPPAMAPYRDGIRRMITAFRQPSPAQPTPGR